MRTFPLYWAANAVLAAMALYLLWMLLASPLGPPDLKKLLTIYALFYLPGTISLITAGIAWMTGHHPTVLIRVATYVTALVYVFFAILLNSASSL